VPSPSKKKIKTAIEKVRCDRESAVMGAYLCRWRGGELDGLTARGLAERGESGATTSFRKGGVAVSTV